MKGAGVKRKTGVTKAGPSALPVSRTGARIRPAVVTCFSLAGILHF
jgi:hypothetical protein